MKKYYNILIFIFICNGIYAQDTINRRYSVETNTIFEKVITTDSCYYLKVFAGNGSLLSVKDIFLKLTLNGEIEFTKKIYYNDTLGVNNHYGDFIQTLDTGFAQLVTLQPQGVRYHMFIKYNKYGDTIVTNTFPEFIPQNGYGMGPGSLIQNPDSTFLGSTGLGKGVNNTYTFSGHVIFKLDKNGQLIWYNTYFQNGFYNLSRGYKLIQYNDTLNLMLISESHNDFYDFSEYKSRIKLLYFDTLGILQQTKIINSAYEIYDLPYGFVKTVDGGLLYCGMVGVFDVPSNGIDYKAVITKLTPNFELEWEKTLGNWGGAEYNNFKKILTLNDSEFVALGDGAGQLYPNDTTTILANYGYLVKFNLNGEVLWERKYIKVPHYDGETNWAKHHLYDMAITQDSGFIMVGQSINFYHTNPYPYGQMGWVVKTDKYGCLVPNCQQYDNIDTTITDTTITTITEPENVLYPNPATTNLYYYNVYTNVENAEQRTCYIYNTQGQLVQQFTVNTDKITYIIDVSQLASGTYIFKVVNANNSVHLSKKFVKV